MLLLALTAFLTAAPAEAWKTMPLPPAMPEPARKGLAEVNGIKLYFAIYGQGAPLILLHGGAGNGDHWANQIAAFAKEFQVIVVDARGHGRSTRDGTPITYEQMADDVIALMDELKLEKAAVLGWSDGGAIGLDLAIRRPERLTKLIAFATNYDLKGTQKGGSAATFGTYFAMCASDYAKLSPTPKDYKGLQAALRPMWRTQPNYTSAQISSIKVPTLVLDGDHDEIIRQEHVKELARLIAGSKLVLLPNSSHFAMFQQPAAFNAAVLDFLK